jgi:hypothetical protein
VEEGYERGGRGKKVKMKKLATIETWNEDGPVCGVETGMWGVSSRRRVTKIKKNKK